MAIRLGPPPLDRGWQQKPATGRYATRYTETVMVLAQAYTVPEPSRREVEALRGLTVLEFGTPWCGHCRRAAPLIAEALRGYPGAHHIKIEDGSTRRLGRLFGVKLWPTLIFLRDGKEVARLVRPADAQAIQSALANMT
jgi:thioredoxin 1